MSWFQSIVLVDWKTVAAVVAAAATLVTLIKGTIEYIKQGTQKRAELFLQMREKLERFRDICGMLEHQGKEHGNTLIEHLSFDKKQAFVGFFEEIAILNASGLMKTRAVHYMFGYYALMCWKSDAFWNGSDSNFYRGNMHWGVFNAFVEKMAKEEGSFQRRKLKVGRYRL